MISYKLFSYFEALEQIISRDQMSNLALAKDLQTMVSNKLFSHAKPLEVLGLLDMPTPFDTKDVIWWPFCFLKTRPK